MLLTILEHQDQNSALKCRANKTKIFCLYYILYYIIDGDKYTNERTDIPRKAGCTEVSLF